MDQPSLAGRVAIVTGGASGIGAATAIALSKSGAKIVINYRSSAAEANDVAATVRACSDAHVIQANIADDADCRRLAESALQTYGRIDILVNNAGTTKFVAHTDLDGLSGSDFTDIYNVNVVGPFQLIRACRQALAANADGAIVNVSSIAGLIGLGSSIAYAASKGALNTMTLSLARALAPEIRVNAVCPGYVATPWFTKRFGDEFANQLAATTAETNPLQRVAEAEDVANAIVFLASPASRQITGETLMVDSGTHLAIAALGKR
jgi:3-oxoacyl-[acyl-carrier protein] reductase